MTTNRAVHPLPFRVLIVDDESSVLTFAARVLTDAGYAVDSASGAFDALGIVDREGSFDLFIVDLMMPQMRGDELARQLRERDPDAKVLYYTGHADTLFQERLRSGRTKRFSINPSPPWDCAKRYPCCCLITRADLNEWDRSLCPPSDRACPNEPRAREGRTGNGW